jgi:hypothetical protein
MGCGLRAAGGALAAVGAVVPENQFIHLSRPSAGTSRQRRLRHGFCVLVVSLWPPHRAPSSAWAKS